MRKVLILAPLLATALLAGCGRVTMPGVYRIDVPQGNIVTQEQLARLEPGMEQRKVRFILGTPLLIDVFNQQRWDYLYEFRPSSGDIVRRRVSLFFEGERLARVDGELLEDSADAAMHRDRVVTVPDMPRDRSLFSGLNPFSDDQSSPPVSKPSEPAAAVDAPSESGKAPDTTRSGASDAGERIAEEVVTPAPSTSEPPTAEAGAGEPGDSAPEATADETAEGDADGGFFRSLARRFGFGDDETKPTQDESDGTATQ